MTAIDSAPRTVHHSHPLGRTGIYLDYGATTPVDPDVLAAMLPHLTVDFGNASSSHAFGWSARDAVELGRAQVAQLIGAAADEVVFTSGATEANVMALAGVLRGLTTQRRHVVASAIEHRSILACLEQLEREGVEVTLVEPRADGSVWVEDVVAVIRPETALVSVMWVNNETGVINPLPELGRALRASAPHILLHTDATQALGRVDIDLRVGDIDLLSMSAHKVYGPQGVGALYVRRGVRSRLTPLLRGGGQEGGLRGGTLNVPGVVGFGAACHIARERFAEDAVRIADLGHRLHAGIAAGFPDLAVNGEGASRVGGTWSLVFPGLGAAALLEALGDDLAVSAGSACSAGSSDVSHVLRATGLPDELARSTLRFVVGRMTTAEEIDAAADLVLGAIASLPRAFDRGPASDTRPAPSMQLQAIGTVDSDVREPRYVPWGEQVSRIVVDPMWAPALEGLDSYSHAVIVFWMHEVTTCTLTHVPQGNRRDAPPVGMFACRCPYRPNPIATTTVRLLEVGPDEIVVQGLDAIDGTPVIDIKPYTPQVDEPDGEVVVPGWVDALVW